MDFSRSTNVKSWQTYWALIFIRQSKMNQLKLIGKQLIHVIICLVYHFNFFLLYKTFKAKKLCIWKCWIIRLEPFSKNFIDFTGIYLYVYQRGRNVTKDRATLQVFSCEVCKFFWNSYSADCVRGVVKTNINI